MKRLLIYCVLVCNAAFSFSQKLKNFTPGKLWLDNNGVAINAHGGNVVFFQDKYYWYGEHKITGKSEAQFADGGIHCYSSKDLMNWDDEGIVLSVKYDETNADLAYGCILERPKVVYDAQQKHFVAYFKYYPKGTKYLKGYLGVATSKKPTGPFAFQHKFLGANPEFGSGDFALVQATDKNLYHLTVRKPDKTFVIGKIETSKMMATGKYEPVKGVTSHTEAPAVIFHNKQYYLLGSGSSGWQPNKARAFVANTLDGVFTDLGNPCIGKNPHNGIGADTTFGGQINYILKVEGKENAYIAMFDIWQPDMPANGLYVWLPLEFKNGLPQIVWRDKWDLNVFSQKLENVSTKVDPDSPADATPLINTDKKLEKWELVFSDEFNDNRIDTTKWTVENSIKHRVDVKLFATSKEVEEKDGNIFIYYKKNYINDTTFMAGRFNSKGKYAPTYGFIETRMHIVKPNGHQTAFWMMPDGGNGMNNPEGVDGTANDGAEIDIVEGTKADAYSSGLHWDGYAKPAHRSNGALTKTPGIHDSEYHTWGFEWTPTYLKFYFDGKLVRQMTDLKLIPHVAHYLYFSGSCFGENNWLDGDIRNNAFIKNGGIDKAYIDYIRVFKIQP